MNLNEIKADERGLIVHCHDCGGVNRMVYENLGREFRCGSCKASLAPPLQPLEVEKSDVFMEIVERSALPLLLDFWASWCGPCKMVAPELVKVARRLAGRCLVLKVNTDTLADLAARFRIQSIPTLVVMSGGREIGRRAGALPAQGILELLQKTVQIQ